MARTVHGGTEALQSFFSAPAWIAWRKEENILPCFRIRQQGECVRITRRESRITAFTVQRSSGISSGANQAPLPRFARITNHETRLFSGSPWVRKGRTTKKPAAQSLFSSSPLFAIVRQKILPGASVLAPSAVPGRPHDKRRSPAAQFPSPSELLPSRGTPGLHVSPRGEAKCVRGPSGRGASRAEEKGASRWARAGVLAQSPPSPLGSRNAAFPVHRPSDISLERTSPPLMVFTKHESRPFYRVLRPSGGEKGRLASCGGYDEFPCPKRRIKIRNWRSTASTPEVATKVRRGSSTDGASRKTTSRSKPTARSMS